MKSSEKNLLLKIARNLEPQEIFDKLKKWNHRPIHKEA